MRLGEHERVARRLLAEARVDSPGLCARLLTAYAAGLDKIGFILSAEQELEADKAERLEAMVARRAAGEPLAYILGEREFYGLTFQVSAATLTPRPETELLVEQALLRLPEAEISFADLGCGSGCIGGTLLYLRQAWQGILADSSAGALGVAAANIRTLGVNAAIIQADIFCLPFAPEKLDMVVSNPPYISRAESSEVMWETLAYEPHCALFSEADGLAHLQAIICQAGFFLKKGGWIILEHGDRQGEAVSNLLLGAGFANILDLPDLAGRPRCAIAQKP